MRRGAVIGIAAAAAALVVGGLATAWLLNRPASADAVAADYLDALAAGDADRAVALLAQPPDADAVAAFAGAAETIDDGRVVEVSPADDGRSRAELSFRLEDQVHTVSVSLIDTSDGWRLDGDALGVLVAETSIGDTIRIGDTSVPAGEAVPLLPAVYTVQASPVGLLDGQATVAVVPGAQARAAVSASVAPGAADRAQEQLEAYADQCAQPAAEVPDACGIVVPWQADLATLERIAFRVERMPAVELSADGRGFDATGGVLVATAYGTTPAGDDGSATYRTDAWALRGSVEFADDRMVLTVR